MYQRNQRNKKLDRIKYINKNLIINNKGEKN